MEIFRQGKDDVLKKMSENAKREIDEMCKKAFLQVYPKSTYWVKLDETIEGVPEGLPSPKWEEIDIPQYIRDRELELWMEYDKMKQANIFLHHFFCFACKRDFMQIPTIRDKEELKQVASEWLNTQKVAPAKTRTLCPNCDGDLKTDSDFYGLIYITYHTQI